MVSGNQWREEKRRARTLSALNLATSDAYNRCRMTGGHTPSSKTVSRDHGGRLVELKVCRACGVPISGDGWAQAMSSARRGRTR